LIWYFSLFFSQGEKSKSGLKGIESLILMNILIFHIFHYLILLLYVIISTTTPFSRRGWKIWKIEK